MFHLHQHTATKDVIFSCYGVRYNDEDENGDDDDYNDDDGIWIDLPLLYMYILW